MVNAPALLTLVRRVLLTPIPRTIARPTSAKLVLVGLALHADPAGGRAYPSRERLASLCEVSPRTLDRLLHDLAAHALIAEQAPPSFTRPRTWRLLEPPKLPEWQFEGWQVDATDRRSCAFVSAQLATDQVQEQEQEQEQVQEQKTKKAVETVETVENPVPPLDVAAVAARNHLVITKIAHTVFDLTGVTSLSTVVDAVLERCRHDKIIHTREVVQRAVAAALVARVGVPTEPLALQAFRELAHRRSS
jgi:hypothetical protein